MSDVERLEKLLQAEIEKRKSVETELQEIKQLVTETPSVAINKDTQAIIPSTDTHLNNDSNASNYYAQGQGNTALSRIVALEQKWLSSDISMNNIVSDLHDIKARAHDIEQYSKLYNLLIHGLLEVPEYKPGSASEFCEWVANLINTLLPDLRKPVTADHIDHAHPMRTKKKKGNVVIVRFANRCMRYDVYAAKKHLKKSPQPNVSFTEHLTAYNLYLLYAAKDIAGCENVWTNDCTVLAKVGDRTFRIKNDYHLNLLRDSMNHHPRFTTNRHDATIPKTVS